MIKEFKNEKELNEFIESNKGSIASFKIEGLKLRYTEAYIDGVKIESQEQLDKVASNKVKKAEIFAGLSDTDQRNLALDAALESALVASGEKETYDPELLQKLKDAKAFITEVVTREAKA